jgi:hypothetical protein
MPLTEKGERIREAMHKQYGSEKGEQVFYASKNKGTISGVDAHITNHPGKEIIPDDRHIPLEEGKSRETVNKNVNRLLEKGHSEEAAVGIAQRKAREDDNQHMGFTKGEAPDVGKLVSMCDALISRMDAFEERRAMQKVQKVKPREKDQMQPSNRHPKEVEKVRPPGAA